jgi:hypothetical protein
MNCLDTRRILMIDPEKSNGDVQNHLAECESCRAFAARLARDEQLLLSSIAIPVPEQLAERILLRTQMQTRTPTLWRRIKAVVELFFPNPAFYAMAASVMLSIGLVVTQTSLEHNANWSEVILAHVLGEAEPLTQATDVAEREFNVALKSYGLTAKSNLGKIRYIGRCSLPGGRGVHAVIDTPDLGQVAFILPPIGVQTTLGRAQREGYASQMTRINQTSIGIVTQYPEKLDALSNRLHQQIIASL